jgi:crotonobetainyl-CoA:carnitine CoA-transferase CaiB-like acyl-CoA transferase
MLDVQVAHAANQAMNYLVSDKVPRRNGNAHPEHSSRRTWYSCADGDVILASATTASSPSCASASPARSGHGRALRDQRPARAQHRRAVGAAARRVRQWEREKLIAALDKAGVPLRPINTSADVFKDPQVKARGMLRHVPHPSGVDAPQVGSPMRFADAAADADPRRRCSGSTATTSCRTGLRRRRHRRAAQRGSDLMAHR